MSVNLQWVNGTYHRDQLQNKGYITTLIPMFTKGRYQVYRACNGKLFVIFNDQISLMRYISEHEGSMFLVRTFKEDNIKHEYRVALGPGQDYVDVVTVASLLVLVEGTRENPIKMSIGSDYLVAIE